MVCVVFDALTLYISIIDAKNVNSLLICIFFSQIDPSANRPAVEFDLLSVLEVG